MATSWRARPLAAVLLVAVGGCGFIEDPGAFPDGNGRTCLVDGDCVPNGCCGQASSAIHVLDAPDCSDVLCSGNCPEELIDCGCGIPICRDGSCTVARTVGQGC